MSDPLFIFVIVPYVFGGITFVVMLNQDAKWSDWSRAARIAWRLALVLLWLPILIVGVIVFLVGEMVK